MSAVTDSVLRDLESGVPLLRDPAGKQMLRPTRDGQTIPLQHPEYPDYTVEIFVPEHKKVSHDLHRLRQAAEAEGTKLARRLSLLREQIQRKQRMQTSGSPDRRRYKRAVAGSQNVYQRQRAQDITSLAVGLQLDMSGSMANEVKSGRLAGVTLAIEDALQRLDAEQFVIGFGSTTAVIKSLGDQSINDRRASFLMSRTLGSTDAVPGLALAAHTFKETRSANKLHFFLSDGAVGSEVTTAEMIQTLRRQGVVPFGIYFGNEVDGRQRMEPLFGEGNWVAITNLSDLSNVVAKRIEVIYRRILATR